MSVRVMASRAVPGRLNCNEERWLKRRFYKSMVTVKYCWRGQCLLKETKHRDWSEGTLLG